MTWLVLTCPIQSPGQREQLVKRRVNFDLVVVYEPNAAGTSLVTLGASSLTQVTEASNQIDAALCDVTHPLRVEEQVANPKPVGIPVMDGWLLNTKPFGAGS